MNRTAIFFVLATATATLAGCADESDLPEGDDPTEEGVVDDSREDGSVDPQDEPQNDPQDAPVDWTGSWTAELTYEVACDVGFNNINRKSHKHTLALDIEKHGDDLVGYPATPTSGWAPMTGSGGERGLILTGELPFLDAGDNPVSSGGNSATLRLDEVVDAYELRGSFEGYAESKFGHDCSVSGGSVTLIRF